VRWEQASIGLRSQSDLPWLSEQSRGPDSISKCAIAGSVFRDRLNPCLPSNVAYGMWASAGRQAKKNAGPFRRGSNTNGKVPALLAEDTTRTARSGRLDSNQRPPEPH